MFLVVAETFVQYGPGPHYIDKKDTGIDINMGMYLKRT